MKEGLGEKELDENLRDAVDGVAEQLDKENKRCKRR